MFCNKCGNQLRDGAKFCPKCGSPITVPANSARAESMATRNLFSQVMNNFNNKGIKCEFILWIGVCLSAVLFLIAAILVGSLDSGYFLSQKIKACCMWVFMCLFSAGAGTLMALRFRWISVLYNNIVFFFIMLIAYFNRERGIYYYDDFKAIMVVIFVFTLLAAMFAVTCSILRIFTNLNIRLMTKISSIVAASLIAFMVLFAFFIALLSDEDFIQYLNSYQFILGSFAYLMMGVITTLYTIFYSEGIINNHENKLVKLNTQSANSFTQSMPEIRWISGQYKGQKFQLSSEVIIGSQVGKVHIVLQDEFVDKQHCSIRYNSVNKTYEVFDMSNRGVYLKNGMRLQRGGYVQIPRNTVLCIGSMNQQIYLV